MQIQKKWFFPLLLLLPSMFFFTACEESATQDDEEFTTEEVTIQALTIMEESGEMGCGACFSLVYPVTVLFPDETEVTVASREEIREAIIAYFEANPPQNNRPFRPLRGFRPELVFPYDVQLEDGSILTIESREDLVIILEDCGFDPNRPNRPRGGSHGQFGGLNHCFNIVFPLTIAFPDGTDLTVADRQELAAAIREWRINNPDAEERPTLAYPYDVELQDGTILTISSDEDRIDLRETCGGPVGDGHGEPCFTVNFPVSVGFPDGSSVEVNSREEALTAIMEWAEANPGATERPGIIYPITVTFTEDGTTQEVNSRLELRQLRRDCH